MLPGRWSEAGRIGNIRVTECPFMDHNKPRASLKDPLLKEFGSYSSIVETN
jgi:hypothetical protein